MKNTDVNNEKLMKFVNSQLKKNIYEVCHTICHERKKNDINLLFEYWKEIVFKLIMM